MELFRSNSALVTRRTLIYTKTILISSILGSVFGLMSIVGMGMSSVEGLIEGRKKKCSNHMKIKNLRKGANIIEANFSRKTEHQFANENQREEPISIFEASLNSVLTTDAIKSSVKN